MISRSVSRLTLNGMFLMTMAVGMTSSSGLTGGLRCARGGEPPAEEKSELLCGESERLSEELLSSHCCGGVSRIRGALRTLTVGRAPRAAGFGFA